MKICWFLMINWMTVALALVFSAVLHFHVTMVTAELDLNCIPKEINHSGVNRTCCPIECGPGEEPKLCMPKFPHTSSCERCSHGTFNPGMMALGDRNCFMKRVCDDKEHMMYHFLGNETHDAECTCKEGFILWEEDPQACIEMLKFGRNSSDDDSGDETPLRPAASVYKFHMDWSSFFIGGCSVFIACFIGVGLWCFFVYWDHCSKKRKTKFQPVSWTTRSNKKQRILGRCHQDQNFQDQCWQVAVESVVNQIGAYWKQLGYKLYSVTSGVVPAVDHDYRDEGVKEKARALLRQWHQERGKEPNDQNEEIIGELLRALAESGNRNIHNEIVEVIWGKYGNDLENQNCTQTGSNTVNLPLNV